MSRDVLQRWSHLSLVRRLPLIEKDFGLRLTLVQLRRIYRQHRVTRRKPQKVTCSSLLKPTMGAERRVFCRKLGTRITSGEDIVYIDQVRITLSFLSSLIQATFHLWLGVDAKIWQPPGERIQIGYADTRDAN